MLRRGLTSSSGKARRSSRCTLPSFPARSAQRFAFLMRCHALHRLTAEIASFVTFIRPTPDEHELRTLVIEGIRRAVKKDWPDAEVYAFGSFGTKLYLPGGCATLVSSLSLTSDELTSHSAQGH